jgi:serine/threonine protein kinase
VDSLGSYSLKLDTSRDIKSSNIMIVKKKTAKLIDFGGARQLNNISQAFGTRHDLSQGKIQFAILCSNKLINKFSTQVR